MAAGEGMRQGIRASFRSGRDERRSSSMAGRDAHGRDSPQRSAVPAAPVTSASGFPPLAAPAVRCVSSAPGDAPGAGRAHHGDPDRDTFFLLSYSRRGVTFGPYHIDLGVYRIGGRTWLDGGNLYGRLPATRAGVGLPFTYPPVAAVLLSSLSLLPMTVASTMLTLGSIALLAVVVLMFLRRAAGPAAASPWALAWLLSLVLFLEPVRDTLGFGQVNLVLMALVSLDCLAEAPRSPRGAVTGLAAAIKLTPAMFVLYFLVRRDRRAACTTAVSFAAVTALGFAVDWHDSVRYWTSIVIRPGRPAASNSPAISPSSRSWPASGSIRTHRQASWPGWPCRPWPPRWPAGGCGTRSRLATTAWPCR